MPCQNSPMLRRGWPVLAVLIVTLIGCQEKHYPIGGKYPEQVYVRVVSLSPSASELLGLLNAENSMIGRSAACNRPESLRDIPIMANPDPNFDLIVSNQADLVVADAATLAPRHVEKLKELGIKLKLIKIDSVDEWIEAVWDLADMFMAQSTASKEIDRVTEAMKKGEIDPIRPQPVALVAMGAGKPWVAGTESFQADILRKAGAKVVGPTGNRFVTVSPEQILEWNPDVVFVSDNPDDYYKSPAWAATKAGKTHHIVGVNPDLLLRAGARVADLLNSVHDELVRSRE